MKGEKTVKRNQIVVQCSVDRRAGTLILAAVAVGAFAIRLSSETLTLATTYPAPVGVYNQIVTTGNAGTVPADTTLARSAGNVVLAPSTNANGRVGVGTSAPLAKLDVAGTFRAGGLTADPAGAPEGALYYNSATKKLRLLTTEWGDVNRGAQGSWCGYWTPSGVNRLCHGVDVSAGTCPADYDPVTLGTGRTCVAR